MEIKKKIAFLSYYSKDQLLQRPSNFGFYVKDMLLSNEFDVIIIDSNVKRKKNKIISLFSLLRSIRKENPDILYIPSLSGNNEFAIFKLLGLLKCNIVGWKYTKFWSSGNSYIDSIISNILWSQYDLIYTMSDSHRIDAINKKLIDPQKISTLIWGVESDWYSKFNTENIFSDFTIIATGKDSRDYETLCLACEKANVNLEVYTRRHHSCVEVAKKYKGSNYCKITFVEDLNIPNEYEFIMKQCSRASVFAICCEKKQYGVGYTNLIDALPFAVPILMTNNKDVPVNTENYGIGYMLNPYDVDAWVDKILYLKNHSEVCLAMSERIKYLLSKDFCSRKTYSRIRQDFYNLIS